MKEEIVISSGFIILLLILYFLEDCGVNLIMIVVTMILSIASIAVLYKLEQRK